MHRAWREKRNEEIARRDEKSAKKHQEIVERAEKAIDEFYQDYNAKKERQIAKNKCVVALQSDLCETRRADVSIHREEEAAFDSKRTDQLAQGTTWERIANLVDLQDSRSKTSTRSTRDLSRFKESLLSLKVHSSALATSHDVDSSTARGRHGPRCRWLLNEPLL